MQNSVGGLAGRLVALLRSLPARRERRRRTEVAIRFQAMFGRCLSCRETVQGHWYWRMASELIDASEGGGGKLAGLVSASQWEAVTGIREWQGDRDVRELYAVRCPRGSLVELCTVVF